MPIVLIKKIKSFNLVLQVEELYHKFSKASSKNENKMLAAADSYILSSIGLIDYLNNLLGREFPFALSHGKYEVLTKTYSQVEIQKKIRVVFAGQVENKRKGAFAAVECSKYLSAKYVVLIIGYGALENIRLLKEKIKNVNAQFGCTKCEYKGLKTGDNYSDFLHQCDIAINPQLQHEEYMRYAFPSKVVSYLCHNLPVVSTRLKTLEDSIFSDLIVLVSDPTPLKFATAIMRIDVNKQDNRTDRILSAHKQFCKDLGFLVCS